MVRQVGDPYEESKILGGIAESALKTQTRPPCGANFLQQALDIFEGLGVPEAEPARNRMETVDPTAGRHTS